MPNKSKYQRVTDRLFDIGTIRIEQKQQLSDMLLSELRSEGFSKVSTQFDGQRKYALALRFEKLNDDKTCNWIEVTFDKYHGRKFQLTMGKNAANAPYAGVRLGNLVRRKGQFYYFWGARAWLPFRNAALARASKRVTAIIPQAVHYLDTGEAGANIHGKEWTAEARNRGSL